MRIGPFEFLHSAGLDNQFFRIQHGEVMMRDSRRTSEGGECEHGDGADVKLHRSPPKGHMTWSSDLLYYHDDQARATFWEEAMRGLALTVAALLVSAVPAQAAWKY